MKRGSSRFYLKSSWQYGSMQKAARLSSEKCDRSPLIEYGQRCTAFAEASKEAAPGSDVAHIRVVKGPERNVAGRRCSRNKIEGRVERDPDTYRTHTRGEPVIAAVQYLSVERDIADAVLGRDCGGNDIHQSDITVARDMRADEAALDVTHA